ncbi:head-tail adaptor protein [Vibrio vulnificus]|nr:head-tail adaptor protein [Vibrio vulnificus]ELH4810070.1 head-tail adaptor protein [Vibrio vulnificus]
MRIGLLRTPIEIWDSKSVVNEYGVETVTKNLLMSCPAAIKEVSNEIVGDNTKSIVNTLEITIRFNRYSKSIDSSMFVVLDNIAYDIVTPPTNNWRLNKYIKFNVVARNK